MGDTTGRVYMVDGLLVAPSLTRRMATPNSTVSRLLLTPKLTSPNALQLMAQGVFDNPLTGVAAVAVLSSWWIHTLSNRISGPFTVLSFPDDSLLELVERHYAAAELTVRGEG